VLNDVRLRCSLRLSRSRICSSVSPASPAAVPACRTDGLPLLALPSVSVVICTTDFSNFFVSVNRLNAVKSPGFAFEIVKSRNGRSRIRRLEYSDGSSTTGSKGRAPGGDRVVKPHPRKLREVCVFFTARRYASALYVMARCPSVRVSVRHTPFLMTLNELQGHPPTASFYECDFCTVIQQLTGFQQT